MNKPLPLAVAPTAIEYASVRRAVLPWLQAGRLNLAQCGMGPALASAFSLTLVRKDVSCLILLGWAGGLVSKLKVGDFVVADKALALDGDPIDCKPVHVLAASVGPMLTVSKALSTPKEKHQAESCGALAVEMEAYPLACKAREMGIPFIHARIILDAHNESIPDFSNGLDAGGKIKVGPFITLILKQPGLIKDMWQFNRRIQSLNPMLADLAVKICKEAV